MPMRLPAQVWRLGAGAPDEPMPAQTLDISGGGLQVTVEGPLGMHDRVRIAFNLTDPEFELATEARVVRIASCGDGGQSYALAFERLERRAEQRIVQLVFAEERRAAAQYSNIRLGLWLPVLFRAGEPGRAGQGAHVRPVRGRPAADHAGAAGGGHPAASADRGQRRPASSWRRPPRWSPCRTTARATAGCW